MEPLGEFSPTVSRPLGVAAGLIACVIAAGLLELSRQLAERHRGRWYAGNGRDVFHFGAVGVITAALHVTGLPAPLAFAVAATAAVAPLMMLDWIHEQRRRAWALLGAITAGVLPALVAPRLTVDIGNAMARFLFRG